MNGSDGDPSPPAGGIQTIVITNTQDIMGIIFAISYNTNPVSISVSIYEQLL
jgi:hypothetical protein